MVIPANYCTLMAALIGKLQQFLITRELNRTERLLREPHCSSQLATSRRRENLLAANRTNACAHMYSPRVDEWKLVQQDIHWHVRGIGCAWKRKRPSGADLHIYFPLSRAIRETCCTHGTKNYNGSYSAFTLNPRTSRVARDCFSSMISKRAGSFVFILFTTNKVTSRIQTLRFKLTFVDTYSILMYSIWITGMLHSCAISFSKDIIFKSERAPFRIWLLNYKG